MRTDRNQMDELHGVHVSLASRGISPQMEDRPIEHVAAVSDVRGLRMSAQAVGLCSLNSPKQPKIHTVFFMGNIRLSGFFRGNLFRPR